MRWPAVLAALLDHVEVDAELVALLSGAHVYHAPDIREYHVPMIGYTVLFFDEDEVFEQFAVQWDVIASPDRVHAIAARLKRLVSAGTPRTVGGMQLRMLFEGGRAHPQPAIGVQRLSFDVRYEPLRSKYQR